MAAAIAEPPHLAADLKLMAAAIAEKPPHLAAGLKALCLSTVAAQWQALAEQAVRQPRTPADYLAQLMHLEVTARRERRIQRRIRDARFPMLKTLDAYSFEAQPDLDRDAVLQTTGGSFRLAGREAEPGAGIRQEGRVSMMLTRAVGPISMTVCSPPSRRVASLHPRFAGLTALTPAARTVLAPARQPGDAQQEGPKSDVLTPSATSFEAQVAMVPTRCGSKRAPSCRQR